MGNTAAVAASAALLVLVGLLTTDARQLRKEWTFIDPEVAPPLLEHGEGEGLRPRYHITPQQGWMNDPNGMFEYKGITHIFFQWNPADAVWGSPTWGHVASSDLVHWKRLPPALVPDTWYDFDGVFSGSAGLLPDGSPILLYTGVSNFTSLQYFYQQQAAAVPAHQDDPELKYWVKKQENPLRFTLPEGATHAQFRDPTTPILQDGRYWTAIGGQPKCVGSAILYSSADFINWKLEGNLLTQVGLKQVDGQCPVAATKTAGNGECDQKGAQCRTWECPDYFEVDGVYVFKYSDQVDVRLPYARDWYVIAKHKPDFARASNVSSVSTGLGGIFRADIACNGCGSSSTPRSIDYGDIYASKTWLAEDGRRLWIGWAFETAKGCFQQCASGTNFTRTLGWQGAQTIPRVITYDESSGSLLFNPVKEIASLRQSTLFSDAVHFDSGSQEAINIVAAGDHTQMEIEVEFSPVLEGNADSNFTFGVDIRTGDDSHTTMFINGTISGKMVTSAGVFVDRSFSGGASNTSMVGGPIDLPANGIMARKLKLHLLIDRSILEVFALGGRGRITARIYPPRMLQPKWGVDLMGKMSSGRAVDVQASAWELSSCWVSNLERIKKKTGR